MTLEQASINDRRKQVSDLVKQANNLLRKADELQKVIDREEDDIWRLTQKHKEEITRDAA